MSVPPSTLLAGESMGRAACYTRTYGATTVIARIDGLERPCVQARGAATQATAEVGNLHNRVRAEKDRDISLN